MSPNYYIETSVSSVTAWSTAGIPFEPRDWLLVFRDQLKSAIAALSPVGGKILYAAYRSPISESHVDVENLLIYNIGPGQLSNATKNGLIFKRFYQISRNCPIELSSPALHQYEYLLVDDKSLSIEGQHKRLLASLSFRSTASALHSCASVWYTAKMGNTALTQKSHIAKPWGISIAIDGPSSTIACSRIVKPLIDGITSALHCHDGSNIDYISKQLGKNLGLDDDTLVKSLLEDSNHALFGRTNLLLPYRNSLQWNPKDDYCTYCSIECLYGLPLNSLGIIAQIFDMEQHEATQPGVSADGAIL